MIFVNDSNAVESCINLRYICILSSTTSKNLGCMQVDLYAFRKTKLFLFLSQYLKTIGQMIQLYLSHKGRNKNDLLV
jgi:hypothetical protein